MSGLFFETTRPLFKPLFVDRPEYYAAMSAWKNGTTWSLSENNPWKYDGRIFGKWQWWTPAQITTTTWLMAADTDTLAMVGNNITQWSDKKSGGVNFVQGTGAYMPSFSADGYNGKPCVLFSGSNNNFLYTSPSIAGYEKTFYAALYCDVVPPNPRIVLGGYAVNNQWRATISYNSATLAYSGDTFAETLTSEQQYDLVAWYNGTAAFGASKNGVGAGGALSNSYTGPASGLNVGQINGRQGLSLFDQFDLRLAELIVCPTLSSADNLKLEGFLAWHNGINSKLPVGHTYKSEAARL